MRKMVVCVTVCMLLVLGSVAGAGAESGQGRSRIVLNGAKARALGLTARHGLGEEVSVSATPGTLRLLEQRGISYRYAVRISLDPLARPKKGGGSSFDPTPYGIEMMYGDQNVTSTSGGAGVRVAVLDTGVYLAHRDFTRGNGTHVVVDCMDFSQEVSDQVADTCADGHGHGTHVTGTVAAAGGSDGTGIWGVSPEASIMAYKVLTDAGSGYSDDIARAIRVAADRGAHIISMSLGSSANNIEIAQAVQYAVDRGVLVVAAAGNSGPAPDTIGYPAALAEVVAVAALDNAEQVTRYSSRGIDDGNDATIVHREIEVAGPGDLVVSTFNTGGYASASGTSMAAPHIAGLAAKQWAAMQGATGPDVREWLRNQARQHDITKGRFAGSGYDRASGYGLPQWIVTAPQTW